MPNQFCSRLPFFTLFALAGCALPEVPGGELAESDKGRSEDLATRPAADDVSVVLEEPLLCDDQMLSLLMGQLANPDVLGACQDEWAPLVGEDGFKDALDAALQHNGKSPADTISFRCERREADSEPYTSVDVAVVGQNHFLGTYEFFAPAIRTRAHCDALESTFVECAVDAPDPDGCIDARERRICCHAFSDELADMCPAPPGYVRELEPYFASWAHLAHLPVCEDPGLMDAGLRPAHCEDATADALWAALVQVPGSSEEQREELRAALHETLSARDAASPIAHYGLWMTNNRNATIGLISPDDGILYVSYHFTDEGALAARYVSRFRARSCGD